MNRLYWQLRQFKHLIGWHGLIGLSLLVYAGFYFFIFIKPAQESLLKLHLTLEETKSVEVIDQHPTEPKLGNSVNKIQDYVQHFPETDSINKTWEQIAKLAKKSRLSIEHMQYTLSQESYSGLHRYDLNMPLKASYPEIRHFLAEVIQSFPNIALVDVSFKRDTVDSPLTEANIDLAVFVRDNNVK